MFTVPALASVGLTQADAEAKGIELRAAVNDVHEWLSGRTYAENTAWAKVLIDNKTDRILGAHLVGHAGEELIHIFALAIKHGITATEIDIVSGCHRVGERRFGRVRRDDGGGRDVDV